MTGPQLQAIYDGEARRSALVARVRRAPLRVGGMTAFVLAGMAVLGVLLPALAMAVTGTPA